MHCLLTPLLVASCSSRAAFDHYINSAMNMMNSVKGRNAEMMLFTLVCIQIVLKGDKRMFQPT